VVDHHDAFVLLALLASIAALLALAPVVRVPYPILLVLGGLAVGFAPGVPELELPPELVLVILLPPLLYGAAFFTSLRDLRTNVRPIGLLAVGLVLATTVAVAVVAHWVVDLPWAAAFTLGAIVSPTDPIAATAVARRLGVPRRIVAIIEGESLVNDATALVAYRVALAAVVSGTFSLWAAGLRFVLGAVGGILCGLAVGWLVRQVRRRLDNPPVEITISLMTGYFAFLPAEVVGVSGVLAAVTAGVYLGWHTPELTTAAVRLQGNAVWEIGIFVLNALLFVLIGLQLPGILDNLEGTPGWRLVGYGAAIGATVVVVRMLWIFPSTYVPRLLSARLRGRDPAPPWQHPALIGWAGMRGAVSLAAALALPFTTDAGEPFPGRDLVIFLSFCVILVTLVGQGLTLPGAIRLLGLEVDLGAEREASKARIKAARAAIARLEELAHEGWVREDTLERTRGMYEFRVNRFAARFDDGDDGAIEERSAAYQRLRRELLDAERSAIIELRRTGTIGDEAMNVILRDLDLEETRLDL
jgi:CPA1 family monovalent cation:H+ antiporter